MGFFLAAVAAASLAYALRPEEVPPELVRAEPVTRRTVVRVVEVSGHLDVRERLEVPAPMVGRLVAIDVSPGDTVHAGQSLAKLDEREASLAVGSARASVTAAASHVAGARVALEAAQADVDRLAHLVPRGLASEAELASARTRVSQAEAQLRAARAEQGSPPRASPRPSWAAISASCALPSTASCSTPRGASAASSAPSAARSS